MADGEIQLAVNLTLGDISKTTRQLKSELQQIFNQNVGNKSMQGILSQIDKTITRTTALEDKIKKMSETRVYTPEFAQLDKELSQALKRVEDYKKRTAQNPLMFDSDKLKELNAQVDTLLRKWSQMIGSGKATTLEINTEKGQQAVAQLNEMNNQMVMLKARAGDASNSTTPLSARFKEVGKSASLVGSAITNMAQSIRGAIRTGISLISRFASTIKGTLLGAVNTVKKAFDKIKSSIEKAFSAKTFKRNLTTLVKYTLGVRSLYFAFRKLRSAVQEGLNNLVQFQSDINETNLQMTEFKTSLLYFKNAWGAAFAPIINVVMPILTALIDMLASVGNAIARFIAALTGQSTVIQALRVGVGDYAQSLAGAGGSAKKAADEQKKLNDRLAAFDDLNVLGKDKDDEDTSPSGGGGGGGNLPSVNDMFERIDTPVSRLAEMIKEAWETGDFFEVGEYLGEKLKEALIKLDTWLLTDGRALGMKIARSIGTLIDGFISVDKLAHVIGSTLGRAIELGIDMVNEIIQPSRFRRIGEFIVEGVNAYIPIVVPKIGELIGNLLHSAISLGFGFIENASWTEWGESFASAINNFFVEMGKQSDNGLTGWQELGQGLSDGAIGFMDMIITAINNLDPQDITDAISQFLEKIDWEALKAKFKELWDTVWEFAGELLPEDIDVEGIKTIIENLAEALGNVASAIGEYISEIDWDKVKEVILVVSDKLKDITAEDIGNFISAIVEIGKFILRLAVVIEILNGISKIVTIFGALKTVIGFITPLLSDLVAVISPTAGALATLLDFSALGVAVTAITVGIREIGKGIEEGGGIQGWIEFFTSDIDDRGVIRGIGGKVKEALLGGLASGLDLFRDGLAGITRSDNPIELLWASLTGDDEYLTDFADSLTGSEDEINKWSSIITGAFGDVGLAINAIPAVSEKTQEFTEGFVGWLDGISSYWSETWTKMKTEASGIWESLKEGWTTLKDSFAIIGEDFKTHLEDWKGNFELGLNAIKDKFTEWKDHITEKVDNIKEKFQEAKERFAEIWQNIKDDFVAKKEEFVSAIEELKEKLDFTEVWTQIKQAFTNGVNGVIDIINGWLQRLADGVNGLASLLNSFSLDIPEVNINGTTYGGGTIGFSVPTISAPQIPHLAQGAVIPPNKEFMAVLGDQKNGTNIEAPLDTIRQAVGDELTPYLEQLIEVNRQVIQAINAKPVISQSDIGRANANYTQQQKVIRGTMV